MAMAAKRVQLGGDGTPATPRVLKTPTGSSEYTAYCDEAADPPALVVQVGKTQLPYQLRCIADLQAMLKKHGHGILLGSADEQKPAAADRICLKTAHIATPLSGTATGRDNRLT
jgi:hypothetical protein